jgi:hypothetical protein
MLSFSSSPLRFNTGTRELDELKVTSTTSLALPGRVFVAVESRRGIQYKYSRLVGCLLGRKSLWYATHNPPSTIARARQFLHVLDIASDFLGLFKQLIWILEGFLRKDQELMTAVFLR